MANAVILGAGVMGTAFSFPLVDRGHQVRLVGTHLDADIIEEIHQNGVHPKLRMRVPDRVTPFTIAGLEEALAGADLVVLGVNSSGVNWAAEVLSPHLSSGIPILMLTKGLSGDGQQIKILPDVFRERLLDEHQDRINIAAVGGPSIAGELTSRRQTCVVFAGASPALLQKLRDMLATDYYHIWTSTDLVGVEVCVALKNAYALGVGLVQGWLEAEGESGIGAAMHNLSAGIFAQGLWEMSYLVGVMGGEPESVVSLPGAGDLYVTSQGGRNSQMGRLLGLGFSYQEALQNYMPGETVEGAEVLLQIHPTIEELVRNGKLNGGRIPWLRRLAEIVSEKAPANIPSDLFFG